jgi:DNA-binding PadR family transcriptional regulator
MLNDVELTILSLVAEGARYGAEIQQLIEARGLREWLTVGSASVYYILARLERQELLTASGDPDPAKMTYQITDAGRGVVQTAVADLLRQPRALGESFALGLANIDVLKPRHVFRALTQHRDLLTRRLEATEAIWVRRQQDETPSDGLRALYTHGIAIMQAELSWLATFIDDWRQRYPAVERDETGEMSGSGAQTQVHHPTADADRAKQMQQLKRPKADEGGK